MKLASALGFYLLTLSRMEAGVRAWLLSCDVPLLPRHLPLPLTENLFAGFGLWALVRGRGCLVQGITQEGLVWVCLPRQLSLTPTTPLSQQGQHMTRVGVGQCISETMKITFIFSNCKEVSFSTRLLSALLTAAVVGVKRETVGATGFSSPLEMGVRWAHTHQFCKLLSMETQTQKF